MRRFATLLSNAAHYLWNGPMGVPSSQPSRRGTKGVAEAIIRRRPGAFSVVAGRLGRGGTEVGLPMTVSRIFPPAGASGIP